MMKAIIVLTEHLIMFSGVCLLAWDEGPEGAIDGRLPASWSFLWKKLSNSYEIEVKVNLTWKFRVFHFPLPSLCFPILTGRIDVPLSSSRSHRIIESKTQRYGFELL